MKYGNATMGQFEAVINKLGGMQGLEDFLADKLEVVRKTVYLLVSLLTTSKFDWVNPNITPENFPEESVRSEDYKVYHFNRFIASEDAVAEMAQDGYLPANLYELIKWNGWDGNQIVVALGSSCVVDGFRFVPYRRRRGSERELDLLYWDGDWGGGCRFLAVATPKN